MVRSRKLSRQSAKLLEAFLTRPSDWRHGYDLISELGLKSGTLYPLLIRLTDRGLLESEWRPAEQTGRPPRHAYRLTPSGISFAQAQLASKAEASIRPGPAIA